MAAVLYGTYMMDNGNRVLSSVNATGLSVPNAYNCVDCADCNCGSVCNTNCGYRGIVNCGGINLYQSANQVAVTAYNCGTNYNCNCNCVCYC